MNKKVSVTAIMLVLIFAIPLFAEETKKTMIAPLCKTCHQVDSNMMRGMLENITLRSKTIQMDLGTHKEIVKYTDCTELKNVSSFEDILNYKGKGFRINYVEKNGEKIAVLITRFDIIKTINPEDRLSKNEFKKFLAENKNAMILDVRPPMVYQEGYIPGAKVITTPDFDKYFPQILPQDKKTPLVFYCVGGCLSPTAAMRATSLGYETVKVYTGGFSDWSQTEYAFTTPTWLKLAIENNIPHVLIDVRGKDAVKEGYIKGAVSIPLNDLDAAKNIFPKQKNALIIFYGNGKEDAAKKVISWGYRSVRILTITYDEWKNAGNPVKTGAAKTSIVYVPKPKPGTISGAEFKKIVERKPSDTVILDVRTPEEVAEGKLKNSINIPIDEVLHRINEIPTGKKIVIHCAIGARAEMAYYLLKESKIESRYLDSKITIKKDGSFQITEE